MIRDESGLLQWLESEVLAKDLFSPRDKNSIFHLTTPAEVVRLVKKIHDDRAMNEHVCHNFEKYRIEFKAGAPE